MAVKIFGITVHTDRFFSLSIGESKGGPAIIASDNKRVSYEKTVFSLADEADIFAAHFLMPEKGFRIYWENCRGLRWADRVLKLKHIYGVIKRGDDPEPANKKLYPEESMAALAVKAIQDKKISLDEGASALAVSKEEMIKPAGFPA